MQTFLVAIQDPSHGLCRTNGHRALLHNNLARFRNFRNFSRTKLAILHVGRTPGTNTHGFGGGVDGNEDNVGVFDFGINVGGEEKVAATALFDDGGQAGFIDGKGGGVPSVDLFLGEIDYADTNL